MTKRGLIDELVARHRSFSRRQAEIAVNAVFDGIAGGLASGRRVEIRGFGSFTVKQRRGRQGRNPKTGEAVAIDEKYFPFFRAGKEVRTEINGAAADGQQGQPA